jgi:hypothetical protein
MEKVSRFAYLVAAWLFLAGVVVQVFLAGMVVVALRMGWAVWGVCFAGGCDYLPAVPGAGYCRFPPSFGPGGFCPGPGSGAPRLASSKASSGTCGQRSTRIGNTHQ